MFMCKLHKYSLESYLRIDSIRKTDIRFEKTDYCTQKLFRNVLENDWQQIEIYFYKLLFKIRK